MNTPVRASLILFACVLALYPVADVWAQLGTDWVARYNGPGNILDIAQALAVDDSGYVYVTGWSNGSGTLLDYATIKYSPVGDTIWVRRYNGPDNSSDLAKALAVDDNGNVYATGRSAGDYATIKYSPVGDTFWVRRYSGPGNSNDHATALALDGSGNAYVTGSSNGNGTDWDFATIKYSPVGDTIWVRRYVGPGNSGDHAQAIAVDDSGNVYVTGRSIGSGTVADYATIKYSPVGDTIWVRRYNGPGNSNDYAQAIAVDDSGHAYVSGWSVGSGTGSDIATIRYSPDGDTIWVRRYSSPGNWSDKGNALALDSIGNVYVTGSSNGNGTGSDYLTIKYSPVGDTIWVRRYNGPGNGTDLAQALAVDDTGNVYVTGWSSGSNSNHDYTTIKYSPVGDTVWIRRYNGPGNRTDNGYALALDDIGNAYVTGSSIGSGSLQDYATIKYSNPTGDVNCDGILDLSDVVLLGNLLDGLIDLTGTCGGGQADADSDGDVDEDDYSLLYDVVAGVQ